MNIRNKLMQTCFFQALLPVFCGLFLVCSRVVSAFCFFFFSFQLLSDRIRKVIRFILE